MFLLTYIYIKLKNIKYIYIFKKSLPDSLQLRGVLLVVADHPDVVVDLEGLAVQGERAGGDGVVDACGHDDSLQKVTTERRTSPPFIVVVPVKL